MTPYLEGMVRPSPSNFFFLFMNQQQSSDTDDQLIIVLKGKSFISLSVYSSQVRSRYDNVMEILLILVSLTLLSLTLSTAAGDTARNPDEASFASGTPTGSWNFRPVEYVPTANSGNGMELTDDLDLAVSADCSVHAVWVVEGTEVLYSVRESGTSGFSDPVVVTRTSNRSIGINDPRIGISENDVVHVVWVEREMTRDGWEVGSSLMTSSSTSRGRSWTPAETVMTGLGFKYPRFEISPMGRFHVTLWRTDATNNTTSACYTLVHAKWLDNVTRANLTCKSQPVIRPFEHHRILVNNLTDSFVVYYDGEDIRINLTDKGGNRQHTYSIHPIPPGGEVLGLGAVLLEDRKMALFWSQQDPDDNASADIHFAWIVFGDGSMMLRIQYKVTTDIELASSLSVSAHGDEGYLGFLRWKERGEGPEGERSKDLWVRVCIISQDGFYHPATDVLMVADEDAGRDPHEDRRGRAGLIIRHESDGDPVLSVTNIPPSEDRGGYPVWRCNTPPSLTGIVTPTDGEWIFNDMVALEVRGALDVDGDAVEYRFRWGPKGGTGSWSSGFIPRPFVILENLEHGNYFWSVAARDPFNGTTDEPYDWWFRVDTEIPTADAGGYYIGKEGTSIELDGSGSQDDGPLVSWEWDINGNGVYDIQATGPIITIDMIDDMTSWIQLRVTDEAGRRSVDSTLLVVSNVAPTIEIVGPLEVHDEATFEAQVSDPSTIDLISIRWAVDGLWTGWGPTFRYTPTSLDQHVISALASDDDGGTSFSSMHVTVFTSRPVEMDIVGPSKVIEGTEYKLGVENVILGLHHDPTIVWTRGGETVGEGPTIELMAGPGPRETVTVGFLYNGAFIEVDSITVNVRERLRPVALITTNVTPRGNIVVEWTVSDQPQLFESYIVRITSDPLPPYPAGDLEWMSSPDRLASSFVVITERSTGSQQFVGLGVRDTYHICIYVTSGEEVACSNSARVTIPADASSTGNDSTDDDEGYGSDLLYIGLIASIALLFVIGLHLIRVSNSQGR